MNSLNVPKPVGIWIRVSTDRQAESDSPEHHEQRARAYADFKQWNIVEIYHLEGVSGKSVQEHSETQRMLRDIQSGHISGLIFSKLARLARNTRELLEFADIFQAHNADLISLQESIDTSTPAGRVFYTLQSALAQWEREEIASRVKASVPIRAKLGKPTGGVAMFGYQWKDQRLLPRPDEAPILKRMFELFVEHKRKKTVARILNEEGHRTRKGKLFTDTTIKRILQDPTPKGLHRANYVDTNYNEKPEDEWVFHEVEAVVSEDLWDEVNGILNDQQRPRKKPTRRPVHLFAGKTFCSCGGSMYVPSNSLKYTCQSCRNKIPTDDLEAVFIEELKGFFFSPAEVTKYLSKADTIIAQKESELAQLQRKNKQLQANIEKLYELYLSGEIPKEGFGLKYNPMYEQLEQIKTTLPELEAEIDILRGEYINKDYVVSSAQDLYSRWHTLTHPEKLKIIETIVDKIVVGKEDIEINLCYLPNLQVVSKGQHTPMDGRYAYVVGNIRRRKGYKE